MALGDMTLADKVATYIKLRNKRDEIRKALAEKTKPITEALDKLEAALLSDLSESGLDHAKSEAGTVYRLRRTSATVKDRDSFMDYIRETDNFEAIDVRANKKVIEELIQAGEEVPGVNFTTEITVGVRKS